MKKIIKCLFVFVLGIILGYYVCSNNFIKGLLSTNYKAFQVGVYSNLEAANTYSSKYNNSIIIKDNELYRVYVSILRDTKNIENMKNYLNNKGINYYLKDVEIIDKNIKKEISEYENIMNNQNEMLFLEMNKLIMEKYKECL